MLFSCSTSKCDVDCGRLVPYLPSSLLSSKRKAKFNTSVAHSSATKASKNVCYNTSIGCSDTRERYVHYPHWSDQGGKPGSALSIGDFKLIEWYTTGKVDLFNIYTDTTES